MPTKCRAKRVRQLPEKEIEKLKNCPKYPERMKLHCLKLWGLILAKYKDPYEKIPFCCTFVSADS